MFIKEEAADKQLTSEKNQNKTVLCYTANLKSSIRSFIRMISAKNNQIRPFFFPQTQESFDSNYLSYYDVSVVVNVLVVVLVLYDNQSMCLSLYLQNTKNK